ncbi:MAG TPA: sigma-70 family RNA polymerase sigma factor [Gemmatimonadales bacterium]|nr:sigma-70 family RNA polymerase sigma factor [Gemmatimonadales bacterium]
MSLPAVTTPNPNPRPSGSADWLARLSVGEPAALGAAYQEYGPALLALAYRLTGSRADAEDVVQDLFVGLPEALQAYRDQGRFLAWLHRVAVRLALMRMRKDRRRREVPLADEPFPPSVEATYPAGDVWRALERLDPEQRALIVLRAIEGYTHEEIAELLGIRRGTAQVRYHRALARLRRWLEDT